jgi:RimJ/RimL family protein N-acetyltransferase
MATAPQRVEDGDTALRRYSIDDAGPMAQMVRECMDHLVPWLPWASDETAAVGTQLTRMRESIKGYEQPDGTWDYAVCDRGGRLIGSAGIVVRDDGRVEIGYWVHIDAVGHGHATRAARMLTEVWREHRAEARIEIRCDEANVKSANVAHKLGYRLEAVIDHPIEAASETGRMMIWALER